MTVPLSPQTAASIAKAVYALKDTADLSVMGDGAGVDGEFDIDRGTRLVGRSGYGPAAANSGFAMYAEGAGTRRGELLVAVRGTASLADGMTDGFTSIHPGATGSGVHQGFSDTYDSIASPLEARLRGSTARPTCVHVVGHSLGGAVATIAASRISQLGHPVKLYTYGSPRVGLGLFTGAATRRIGARNIYRVHHVADPVTMVPLFPFLHVPVEGIHYRLPWTSGAVDVDAHFMDGYISSIGNAGWAGLRHAVADNDTVANIEGWLEFAASSATAVMPMSTWALRRIGQALNWMIQIAGGGAVLLAAGAEFVSDMVAALLIRAANLVRSMGTMLANLVRVIMRVLGRTVTSLQEVTVSFLTYVLDLLFSKIGSFALRAIRRVV